MPRTDTASRVIPASPERVYAAFVDAEALAAWLPPDGMTATFERFDLRRGGSYRLVLTYADSSLGTGKATFDSDIVEARFVDVVPDARVIQEVDFVSDGRSSPCRRVVAPVNARRPRGGCHRSGRQRR